MNGLRRIVALLSVAAMTVPVLTSTTAVAETACRGTVATSSAAPAALGSATAEDNGPGSYRLGWTVTGSAFSVYAATSPGRPACSGRLVARTTSSSVTVNGLASDRRWYFEIVPAGRATGVVTSTRVVPIDGVHNTRDLGGYATADGRTVRWGVLYRSAHLAATTDTGLTQLAALGLRTVVDHRGDGEVEYFGPDRVPARVRLERHPMEMPAPVDEATNLENYRKHVTDPLLRQAIAATIVTVGRNGGQPVLMNCSAGVDRVGWVSAVLLEILGVPRQTILADYLLSNQVLGHELAKESLLRTSYDMADQMYGSFAGYVRDGLGISDATVAMLRARLLS